MTNSTIITKENIIEEVYLTNHEDFVKVNNLYYGGLQKWLYMENLKSKFWADRSCGVTAAANALVHMATYRKGLEKVYRYPSLSRLEASSGKQPTSLRKGTVYAPTFVENC